MTKINLDDVTFVIPIKVDSDDRFQNLQMAVSFLLRVFEVKIAIFESLVGGTSFEMDYIKLPTVVWHTIEEADEVFHRTKILNKAILKTSTEFVAIWDADVIVAPSQIIAGLHALRRLDCDFVLPYDGRFLNVSGATRSTFLESGEIASLYSEMGGMMPMYTHLACGGAFLARRKDYIEVGLENENFRGWGNEDGERVSRWRKMGKRISRVEGPLFHLDHPRGINSSYISAGHRERHLAEFYRIDRMSKSELEKEVNNWKNKG